MKANSHLSRKHQRNKAARPAGAPAKGHVADVTLSPPWLPRWAISLGAMLLAAVATYAVFEYLILSHVPYALLGKWQVVEAEKKMAGATMEFFRDGTMIAIVNMNGNQGLIKARVEVEGQTLRITSINLNTKMPETDAQTILTLTDTQLVVEDHKGSVIKLERLSQ